MNRIKIEVIKDRISEGQYTIYNVNNDFIGRLSKSDKKENNWLFCWRWLFQVRNKRWRVNVFDWRNLWVCNREN